MPSYEWNATAYHSQSAAQFAWAGETIEKLQLTSADHVLDIGCGDGKVTARIADLVPDGRVVGIDSSASMIDFASRAFADRKPHLSFELVDASAIPYCDDFDAVYSNAALHWIQNHAPVLLGIQKALHPGGRVCMQMGGRGNAAEVHSAMDDVCARPAWSPYFVGFESPYSFYGPQEYDTWLRAAGLTPERVELVNRPMRHTREQFAGWLATTWMPYTSRVPLEDRARFIDQVVDRFVEHIPPDSGGILTVPMVRLNVAARKATQG